MMQIAANPSPPLKEPQLMEIPIPASRRFLPPFACLFDGQSEGFLLWRALTNANKLFFLRNCFSKTAGTLSSRSLLSADVVRRGLASATLFWSWSPSPSNRLLLLSIFVQEVSKNHREARFAVPVWNCSPELISPTAFALRRAVKLSSVHKGARSSELVRSFGSGSLTGVT